MEFKPLDLETLTGLLPFFRAQRFRLSDYTGGFRHMWRHYIRQSYAVEAACLCLRTVISGEPKFTYPLSPEGDEAAEAAALSAVEAWCVERGEPLRLMAVPAERLTQVTQRYGRSLTLTNPRTWRDYLYRTEDFVNYAGKRFAGQRNHVSKFRRSFPDAVFRPLTESDLPAAEAFLETYSKRQYAKHSFIANEELSGTKDMLNTFAALGQIGGMLWLGETPIALTFGEIAGDTLVIHVEKALVGYDGVYPTVAREFARHVAETHPEIAFVNREDDAGDCGLRKSKLQYNPIRILDKYNVIPHRVIDELSQPPIIDSPRLRLRAVTDAEVHDFGRLARDIVRNRHWGWDWRTAWKEEGDPRDAWFLNNTRLDFEAHREISLGIFADGSFVGEGVYHNFTYSNTVEIGIRLLPEAEKRGYASETVRAMADYALCYWGLERATAKCYRDNLASKAMLERGGLRNDGADATFLYFSRTAKN